MALTEKSNPEHTTWTLSKILSVTLALCTIYPIVACLV